MLRLSLSFLLRRWIDLMMGASEVLVIRWFELIDLLSPCRLNHACVYICIVIKSLIVLFVRLERRLLYLLLSQYLLAWGPGSVLVPHRWLWFLPFDSMRTFALAGVAKVRFFNKASLWQLFVLMVVVTSRQVLLVLILWWRAIPVHRYLANLALPPLVFESWLILQGLNHLVLNLFYRTIHFVEAVILVEQWICVVHFVSIGSEHVGRTRKHLLLMTVVLLVIIFVICIRLEGLIASTDDPDRHNVILLMIHWLLSVIERRMAALATGATAPAHPGNELVALSAALFAAELLLPRPLVLALNWSHVSLDILYLGVACLAIISSCRRSLLPNLLMMLSMLLNFVLLLIGLVLEVALILPLHLMLVVNVIQPVHLWHLIFR